MREYSVKDMVDDFEDFLTATEDARTNAERDRDYVDHAQWTALEEEELTRRGQAPVVINRVKNKVNTLKGVQRQTRTMPKALPRTPAHEEQADAATDSLRYVAQNNDLGVKSTQMFEDMVVWGTESCIVEVQPEGNEPSIRVNRISPDRFYYDPYSRELDFSDARYLGIVVWMDHEDAQATFPDKKDEIAQILTASTSDGHTFEDKPTWVDRKRKRIRVCQHYYRHNGVWHVCYFTDTLFLVDPRESGYVDEFGAPACPILAQSAYINLENERYGEVRAYIWIQDEINHRRSKLLYLLSVRQTMGEEGAVTDITEMKQELAKANGHVRINPGMQFEILPTGDMANGQFQLYQESKAEIDQIGANAALSGDTKPAMSGRALQALQQGGVAELTGLFDQHKQFEKTIYRHVWARVRQFWTAEKWIRVTDQEDNLKWVGLNQPVTIGQMLQERAEQGDQTATQALQQMMMNQDPRLGEIADIRYPVAELDVDIILSESPDFATLRHEQFALMGELAKAYGPEAVPFEVMLKLSDLPNKDEVEKLLQPEENNEAAMMQAEMDRLVTEMQIKDKELEMAQKEADLAKTHEEILQKQIETQKLAQAPEEAVTVSV